MKILSMLLNKYKDNTMTQQQLLYIQKNKKNNMNNYSNNSMKILDIKCNTFMIK